MLPNCGHAFSRAAVQGLIDAQKGKVAPGPSRDRKGKAAKPPPFNCMLRPLAVPINWPLISTRFSANNSARLFQRESCQLGEYLSWRPHSLTACFDNIVMLQQPEQQTRSSCLMLCARIQCWCYEQLLLCRSNMQHSPKQGLQI
jgi:hypothetical protein